MRYSVVGLGKLGAAMAAAIASRGHHVIGVDVNPETVKRLNSGHAPVQETGLQDLVAANRNRLRATTSFVEAVRNSDVSFVVVPTPSDERGAFQVDQVAAVLQSIGTALREKPGYHLVVVTSTVLPGSTRTHLLPALEGAADKRCGHGIGLCYSPLFVALGNVIRDFLHPDVLLIGEMDSSSGTMLERCYRAIVMNAAQCKRMSPDNAELAKLAINAFITTKVSFANMLAGLCERLPGGDVDLVTDAVGLDTRIGGRYLTGGLGFGGPCFPRDNAALCFVANQLGASSALPMATQGANRQWARDILERILGLSSPASNVAVLGLAYKPGSGVIDESQGLFLASELAGRGLRVLAYDAMVTESLNAAGTLGVQLVASPQECVASADVVVVALPDPTFTSLCPDDFGREQVTVFDCWRLLEHRLAGLRGIRYLAVGKGPPQDDLADDMPRDHPVAREVL